MTLKAKHFYIYSFAAIGMILIFTLGFNNYPGEPSTPSILTLTQNPTLDNNDILTTDGEGTEEFISSLSESAPEAKYNVYANSTNIRGVYYGIQDDFNTIRGSGTKEVPYLIATPEQLDSVRYNLDKHFKQIADINLSNYSLGSGWNPIGDEKNTFTGTYDGNGYQITNLIIDRPSENYSGLFGYINNSIIKNVALEIVNVTGNEDVGGLVGRSRYSIITGSYVSGKVTGENNHVGGLVGSSEMGNIRRCYTTVYVKGNNYVGGLAGLNIIGNITDSYATGDVSGNNRLGGLVGSSEAGNTKLSYATGNVTGNNHGGGLIGYNTGGGVTVSYATGNVTGNNHVGGLVGRSYMGNITSNYASGDVTGSLNVGGLAGSCYMENIKRSYATGNVTGHSQYAGGLIGSNTGGGDITDSYAAGDVSGNQNIGGLVGSNSGNITDSYATGNVSGNNRIGGLVGSSEVGNILRCYSIGDVTEK